MGIFIFFNPFPHTTSIKEICYYLSVFIVIILILSKKNDFIFKTTPLFLPFTLFALWSLFGLFFALNKGNSIHDFYAHFMKYIVLYYILINYFSTKKLLTILSWIIISSSTIFALGTMIYFYFILGYPLSERLTNFIQISLAVIGIIEVYGLILTVNIFIQENHLYRKIILGICFNLLLFLIILTQTRSSLLALFLAVIIIFFNNKKLLIILLGIILIIVFILPSKKRLFSYNTLLIASRAGINYQTFEIMKDYPIIGIGFGMQTYGTTVDLKSYYEKVPKKYREKIMYNDPHNMFMDIAVRLGVVGFVLFFYIIFVFFKMCWDIIKYGKNDFAKNWGRCLAGGFFSFLIIGFFHPVFSHMPETILCVMFSMLTIVWRLNTEPISKDVA